MNDIYLRRSGKILLAPGQGGATRAQVATVAKEAEQLGFVLTQALFDRLCTLSVDELTRTARDLLAGLRALTGAHRVHAPLYPGFPQQVLRLSETELYLNALWHYLTLYRMPRETGERPPLLHGKAVRVIDLGTSAEFEQIFTRLAGAKSSLSVQDKADLDWFVRRYCADIYPLMPKAVPFRENVAVLGAALLKYVPGARTEAFLRDAVKSATDVLRLAVALAGGDVSLAIAGKFKSLSRSQRRLLLGLIEATEAPAEEMLRWAERWKRLGERLHPGSYADRFPKTAAAFDIIRNDRPCPSLNATVEAHLRAGAIDAAEAVLEARPGELARRLDHLLRQAATPETVLAGFARVASKVSSPVLLQVLSHFRHRGRNPLRVFFPKGEVAKVFALKDRRPALDDACSAQIVATCEAALIERFSRLAPLGTCYVDPALADYRVPFAQRSASRALRTLVRGSRLPLPDAAIIRLFIWWMNGTSRVDIDLSAALYGPDFDFIDQVAYYNLKTYGAYHSGDIVNAPKGAAEFIDLDLARLREKQVRFVVMSLHSFTEQPYCEFGTDRARSTRLG